LVFFTSGVGSTGSAGFQPTCCFYLLIYFMQAGSLRYLSAQSAFKQIFFAIFVFTGLSLSEAGKEPIQNNLNILMV